MVRLNTAIVVVAAFLGVASAFPSAQRATTPGSTPAKTTADIAALAGPAVVTIVASDENGKEVGQGSGFIVRPEGVVLTNWHVLSGASSASVALKSGEIFKRVAFLDGDKDADIALIKIPGFGLPILNVAADIPAVGAKVVTVGSPLGLSDTVSEGIVSAVRILEGRQLVQITAPISPGSSGGPVLDPMGRVFAISTLTIESGQQLNFAVPVKYAMGLVRADAKERPLAEVFAVDTPATKGKASPVVAKPQPTARPVPALDGSYLLNFDTSATAIMVSGREVGLVAILGATEPDVVGLQTLRTNSMGEVAVSFGGIASGGFQTDEGFWASGDLQEKGKDGVVRPTPFSYKATRYLPPISVDTGVYRVRCRTSYQKGSYRGTATDWEGDAAIITTSGKVHVNLLMRNSVGGSTELYASGPIDPAGQFNLQSDGNQLVGSLRAGAISGQWTDRRTDGSIYQGQLTGQRR